MTEVGVDYPSCNSRSEEVTKVVEKSPCADCIVRLVINPINPELADSELDQPTRDELCQALEQSARDPAEKALNSLRVAICYCDHQHRWADMAGLSDDDKGILKAKKARRKFFPKIN